MPPSQALIEKVSKMPPEAQQHPQVQADLEQAKKVVAEDAARKASPSTPPQGVAKSQALIENVSKMPPEAQQHPQVQADLEQAKKVVAEDAARNAGKQDAKTQTSPRAQGTKSPTPTTNPDVGGAAAHGKTMDTWDNNPNNQVRTMPEAVEIFRKNFKEFMQLHGKKLGVHIDPKLIDQINFVPDPNIPSHDGKKKWAIYAPEPKGTGINGEHTWKDFLKNGKVKVGVDPEVLKSDQAIAGIFAHELLELHGIQDKMDSNVNHSLPREKLQQHINDLHEQAINLQNHFVQFMKDKARKQ